MLIKSGRYVSSGRYKTLPNGKVIIFRNAFHYYLKRANSKSNGGFIYVECKFTGNFKFINIVCHILMKAARPVISAPTASTELLCPRIH